MLFDPVSPEFLADPYAALGHLRKVDPVHWYARGHCWVPTRYADIRHTLTDPRFGHQCAGFPEWRANDRSLDPRLMLLARNQRRFEALWMVYRSPPDHTRLRALWTPFFTRPAVERLRPYIQARVDELLDRCQLTGAMDLVGDLADHLPFDVACEALGVPDAERPEVKEWLRDAVAAMGLHLSPAVRARGAVGMLSLTEYFRRVAKRRREQPGNDPVSALVTERSLTEDELAANCVLVLVGGDVSTRAIIPHSMLALLRHPDQLQRLRSHPGMLRAAVEELIRYDSAAPLVRRTALEDVELGGRKIRRGERVLALTSAANRDPAQFERPDHLDLTRTPNSHIGFGAGIHFCLGAHLARVELEITLRTILRRMPGLGLRAEPVEWVDGFFPRSLKALRVSV